ncbi:MAG: META domain-containing protein [Ignavibacteriaceae bacterium]|nr:META domain-containing protein [Ignavibacteriaceae bacterium]
MKSLSTKNLIRKIFQHSLSAIILLLMFSCSSEDEITRVDFSTLINLNWQLQSVTESGKAPVQTTPGDSIFIVFRNNGRLEGHAQGLCGNYYGGIFSVSGNEISFDSLNSTEAACEGSLYWDYYSLLFQINSFSSANNELYLYTADKRKKITYVKTMVSK